MIYNNMLQATCARTTSALKNFQNLKSMIFFLTKTKRLEISTCSTPLYKNEQRCYSWDLLCQRNGSHKTCVLRISDIISGHLICMEQLTKALPAWPMDLEISSMAQFKGSGWEQSKTFWNWEIHELLPWRSKKAFRVTPLESEIAYLIAVAPESMTKEKKKKRTDWKCKLWGSIWRFCHLCLSNISNLA